MANKINTKEFLKNYGILLLILVLFFSIVIYLAKISDKPYKDGLKKSIEKVLMNDTTNQWKLGDYNNLKSSISLNAFCYDCTNLTKEEACKAVIVRVSSFYGPISVVYICDSNNVVEVKGISSFSGKISKQFNNLASDKRIKYWQEKIPELLK